MGRTIGGLLLLTVLLGGCPSDDPGTGNGGMSPIVDEASGWVRIKSIAPQGPIGIGTSMSLTAVTRIAGAFTLLEKEVRGSQGGDLSDRFTLRFPEDAPADGTTAPLVIGEQYDPFMSGGLTAEYRYAFAPGTADVYQSFRETTSSGGSAETWSGLRIDGSVTVGMLRSSGGGNFAGLADLHEGGRALIPGADLFSAYFHDGDWQRIYGRYSDITEPTTVVGYPVQLADQTPVWALLQPDAIAIGGLVPRPMVAGDEQIKTLVTTPPPPGYVPERCYARAFGDRLVFVSASVDSGVATLSAHRWTAGAATIETLYANVVVPATMRLPEVANNGDYHWVLDEDGQLTFLADQQDSVPTATALIHVDATGPHVAATIPGGPYLVQGPWVIDGDVYAGIGALATREVTQLDLVRLRP